MNANQFAIAVGCVILSLMAAFFLVFNGLFTDGPKEVSSPQRLVSYALVLAGYGLLGATSARLARPWWAWPLGLALPALAICVLYPIKENGGMELVSRAFVEATAVVIGVLAGAWLARPRAPPPRPAPPARPMPRKQP